MRAVSSLTFSAVAFVFALGSLAVPAPAEAFLTGSCMTNSDCLGGEICELGTCVPGCASDLDCLEGEVCELESATCVVPAPPTPEELVAEACPCDAEWRNHGQYVVCVVFEADALGLDSDVVDGLVATAAESTCGR